MRFMVFLEKEAIAARPWYANRLQAGKPAVVLWPDSPTSLLLSISWDVTTLRIGYIESSPPAFHKLDFARLPQGLRAFLWADQDSEDDDRHRLP
jgi:hypothetical protein